MLKRQMAPVALDMNSKRKTENEAIYSYKPESIEICSFFEDFFRNETQILYLKEKQI